MHRQGVRIYTSVLDDDGRSALNGLSRGKVGDVFERYVDGKGAIEIGMMDSPGVDKEGDEDSERCQRAYLLDLRQYVYHIL